MSDDIADRLAKLEATISKHGEHIEHLQGDVGQLKERIEGPVRPARPATATPTKSASGGERKSTTPSGKPTPGKKAPNKTLPVIFQPRVAPTENKADFEDTSIDPSRKGFYQVGNRKIYYVLPQEFAGQGGKTAPPATELKLEYAFGYNGKTCRNNLFFSNQNNGEIIYNIAGTGVVMNPETKAQRFFLQHIEDILSLAAHPSRPLVATGQLDPKGSETPYICIWDTTTMECVKRITFHQRGIIALAFSPDGKYLISIGNEDSHQLALWEWRPKKRRRPTRARRKPTTLP